MDAYHTDRFYQVYGMTETGPLGTALHPGEQLSKALPITPIEELHVALVRGRVGSVGRRYRRPSVDLP